MLTANTLYDVKGVSDGTTWYLYCKLSTETEWTLSYSCDEKYLQSNKVIVIVFANSLFSSYCE